ncbi:MAG: serine hydrolase [Owenweeksia sp.]|nr:serine hydrolase [Owenweeksia sp.]
MPTENDQVFRQQLLRGYVHDQGAAMLGGVAGHAGLFSNANDFAQLSCKCTSMVAIMVVSAIWTLLPCARFTRCQYCDNDNRRGIGFDKPQLEGPGPTCGCVSPLSYGHTGFTGTIAWADPDEEIVYIFLSNRVHPDASNRELLSLSTRTRIQKVIYNSIEDESENTPVITEFKP